MMKYVGGGCVDAMPNVLLAVGIDPRRFFSTEIRKDGQYVTQDGRTVRATPVWLAEEYYMKMGDGSLRPLVRSLNPCPLCGA